MKFILLFISFGLSLSESYALGNYQWTDTSTRRILIINAFDASNMKARNNKKELFAELADSLKQYLRSEMMNFSIEPVVVEELVKDNTDSTVSSLLLKYNCPGAVVINSLNVYFEQTGVEVTKDNNGKKSREATYDICSDVQYFYFRNGVVTNVFDKKRCNFFTKRNVASGMLAAGPDIVGKSKYAFIAVQLNSVMGATEMTLFLRKEMNR